MLDVYHAGEIAVQERVGDRQLAQRRGSIIADRLSDGARAFVSQQGLAAVAVAAPDGTLWASVWCGEPGFLRASESGERVELRSSLHLTDQGDIARDIVRAGDRLGMVVIDFATRRRLRINGVVNRAGSEGLELNVRETFGNCQKYIQRRHRGHPEPYAADVRQGSPREGSAPPTAHGVSLDDERRAFVARTDTLFVASINAERGLDASHRGGEPGFVHVVDDATLRIPDYEGNSMYQTLGNFEVDSRASLALVDFERRRVLSLTGNATTEFGADDPRHPAGGTGRYWSFTVRRWIELSLPASIGWTLLDRSPFNPPPGV